MWIEVFLKCKILNVHTGRADENPTNWHYLLNTDYLQLIVKNEYHPRILVDKKDSTTNFVFESMDDSLKVYEAFKKGIVGKSTEIPGIGYIKIVIDEEAEQLKQLANLRDYLIKNLNFKPEEVDNIIFPSNTM